MVAGLGVPDWASPIESSTTHHKIKPLQCGFFVATWSLLNFCYPTQTENADVDPLAGALIVLVLVWQFKGYRKALIVLSVIPLTLSGVTLALLAMPGAAMSFVGTLGLLSLAGIIINNAIVLIDRIDLERADGRDLDDAIMTAATLRFRPIIMTTITTVLGLMPLIIFQDILFYDLAVVLSGGLIVGTILTLGVVPVLYRLLFGLDQAGSVNQ